jgi:hypothetical protein
LRVHGVTKAKLGSLAAALFAATMLLSVGMLGAADEAAQSGLPGVPPPAWPSSPFHGVISGATGEPIPCRCRYKDSDFRLGETVCMNTHLGVQLARCDLHLNNTSWIPLGVPCTMSRRPASPPA